MCNRHCHCNHNCCGCNCWKPYYYPTWVYVPTQTVTHIVTTPKITIHRPANVFDNLGMTPRGR